MVSARARSRHATNPAFERCCRDGPELSYLLTHPPDPSNAKLPDESRSPDHRGLDPRGRTEELSAVRAAGRLRGLAVARLGSRDGRRQDPQPRGSAAAPRGTPPRGDSPIVIAADHDRARGTPQRARSRCAARPLLLGASALSGAVIRGGRCPHWRWRLCWASRCCAPRDCPRGRSSCGAFALALGSRLGLAVGAARGARVVVAARATELARHRVPRRVPLRARTRARLHRPLRRERSEAPGAPLGASRRGDTRVLRAGHLTGGPHGTAIALCAIGALAVAPTLCSGRALAGETAARARVVLFALAPDTLIYGATSYDAAFVPITTLCAWLLYAPRAARSAVAATLPSCSATRSRWLRSGRRS